MTKTLQEIPSPAYDHTPWILAGIYAAGTGPCTVSL